MIFLIELILLWLYNIITYKKRHMNGFEKLILRLRRVHEVDIVLHHPDSSSLTDVASARNIVGRQSCPMLTPFSNYLNQVSAISQPLPGLPQKQTLLPEVCVKVTQSCPTLCDPMDYTIHGILQARILEWVAFPFSRESSQPRDRTQVYRIIGRFFTSWATRKAQEYWSG